MYTLAILNADHTEAEERTLDEWGISEVSITQGNTTPSTLTFSLAVQYYHVDHPFSFRAGLSLRANGTQVWIGYVTSTPRYASGSEESIQISAQDALWYLTRYSVPHTWTAKEGQKMGSYTVPTGKTAQMKQERGVLFAVDATEPTDRRTTADEWQRLKDHALNKGIPLQFAHPIIPAYSPPPQSDSNRTALDLLRYLQRWHPDSVIYVDHSTTPGTLRWRSMSLRPTGIPSSASPDTSGAVDWWPKAGSIQDVSTVDLSYLAGDMEISDNRATLPSGVIITFKDAEIEDMQEEPVGADIVDLTENYIQRWPSTAEPDDLDVIAETVDWTDQPLPAVNLAQVFYRSLSALGWSADITFIEEECSVGSHLGRQLNILGGREEWATMRSVIQSVQYDIDLGTTHITAGPAPTWSLGDFVDLFFRRASSPADPTDMGVDWGSLEDEEEEDEEDPNAIVEAPPLILTTRRPPGGIERPAEAGPGIWISWGLVISGSGNAGVEPTGVLQYYALPVGSWYVWVRINFSSEGELVGAIVQGDTSSYPSQPTPNESTGAPPSYAIFPLGRAVRVGDEVTVLNTGAGSVGYWLSQESIRTVVPTAEEPGGIIFRRIVRMYRMNVS